MTRILIGVAPSADIIAVQVFTRFNSVADCGSGNAPCVMSYDTDQVSGLQRVYNLRSTYDIAAVNMSLGGGQYFDQATCDADNAAVRAMVQTLRAVEIATVISSGNDGFTDSMGGPGCISEAVGIGATTDADTVASFSNSHPMVDLLAPGVSINSSIPPDTYDNYQGTSMAAPHVTGTWALLKSVDPAATVDEILTTLENTGVPVTDSRNGLTRSRIQLDAAANDLLPTYIWEGDTSNLWGEAANWSSGSVPNRLTDAVIPTNPVGGSVFPLVNIASAEVRALTIETGATAEMMANTLSVFGDWTVQGTGSFNASGGTVVFAGSGAQSATQTSNPDDHFYHLQIGAGSNLPQVTLQSDLNVDGDLSLLSGSTLSPGSNTISLAGDWTDPAPGFTPGTSQVIMDGSDQGVSATDQTLLLDEDFSDFDGTASGTFYFAGPAGWAVTQDINPTTSIPWLFGNTTGAPTPTQGGHARHIWNGSYPGNFDTWLFTPGLNLNSQATYRLEFDYGARSESYPENLVVRFGTGQTSGDMTTDLFDDIGFTHTTWNSPVIDFSVPSDGVYYIGFQTYGEPDLTYDLALDNIQVTQFINTLFYDLSITGGSPGVTLTGDTRVLNDLTVIPGAALNLDAYSLAVNGSLTNNGTLSQTLDIPSGSTTEFLHIQNAAGSADQYRGVEITPNSTGLGQTTVGIKGNQSGGCTTAPADPLIQRCFQINPGSQQAATLRFWYTEAERNGQNANDLRFWHYDGPGSWSAAGDTYTYSEAGTTCTSGGGLACWAQALNVSTYSPFGLGGISAPTALHLEQLSAAPLQPKWLGLMVVFGFGLGILGLVGKRLKQ